MHSTVIPANYLTPLWAFHMSADVMTGLSYVSMAVVMLTRRLAHVAETPPADTTS